MPRLLFTAALLVGLLGHIPAAGAQEVNFDFENADLRAVIQAVAKFTGRNFLVDPRVKGKVTVVAPAPLAEEEAYKVFQSVLEVNG
ncbi:MAG TPA: type II secretion system protein GspD, partial [Gammaproteobacteria bacterium]|nr:type II secretion system protein GspD [Gammaproteobacteria bacterium]